MDYSVKELKRLSIGKLEELLDDGIENGFQEPLTEDIIRQAINEKMIGL